MDRVHDGFRAAFAALGVGALLAMASSCGPSTPAFAAGEVIAVAGCDVVVAPTPEVHTECPGWDATGIDTFPGIETVSWDYADLSGATITGTPLLEMVGRLSIEVDAADEQLEITVKEGEDSYKKHFVGLSPTVTYVIEDITGADVSAFRYEVSYLPESIIPIEYVDGSR